MRRSPRTSGTQRPPSPQRKHGFAFFAAFARDRRGFTLLELIVVLAVIGILALALTPAVVQRVLDARIDATRAEEQSLVEGMIGRADQPGNFGFYGDMGRFPQAFTELAQAGGLPISTTATQQNIAIGWRGPYVNIGTSSTDYLTDAFGRPYTGASSGQVRSSGPDGVAGTADDIAAPPNPPVPTGRVLVTVMTTQGNKTLTDPAGYDVTLFYSNGGVEGALTDQASPFVFDNVPMGLHAVRVTKRTNPGNGSVMVQKTITSYGSGRSTAVELWF